MEKVVKVVDKERGIVQVTTPDERWYTMQVEDPKTKLPVMQYVPSVTWIASYYPKGIGFMKWLAEHGWDESQAIKEAAGDRGSKVDTAVKLLLDGFPIAMDGSLINPSTGEPEPITLEEYQAIMSFVDWYKETTGGKKPKKVVVVAKDVVLWNRELGFAGTADLILLIDGVLWLIDLKTSQAVWPSHEIQVSAYKRTPQVEEIMRKVGVSEIRLAILQLGYRKNKTKAWKWTEIEDQFDLFLATRKIWAKETEGQVPLQRDYPVSLSLENETPEPAPALEAHAGATD